MEQRHQDKLEKEKIPVEGGLFVDIKIRIKTKKSGQDCPVNWRMLVAFAVAVKFLGAGC